MPLLETRGLSKRFPGIVALDDVDFEADAGEVRAVVGANGAGKSTFMNILAGVFPPSSGEIRLAGQPVAFASPRAAHELGINVVFQEFSSTPELTVAENIFLGREPISRYRLIDRKRMRREAAEILDRYHLDLSPDAFVGSLSVAQRQQVELARALSSSARILILDEPTAVLSPRDWENLRNIIGHMVRESHLVLYVSHRLDEVFAIADRITVLRNGRAVATGATAAMTQRELVQLMTGREARKISVLAPPQAVVEPPLLSVAIQGEHGPSGFHVNRGEIVGLGGLVGSGRTALARSLIGLTAGMSPAIAIDGKPVHIKTPREAFAHGIAYLTEDRKRDGLFANLSVTVNCSAATLPAYSPWGILREDSERSACASILDQLGLVARSLDMAAVELSGGNQQKVVMARALLARPRILICDEPTRGVDVQAKVEIYELLQKLAAEGVGVLLISSEFSELLSLTHRILVVRHATVARELVTADINEELLLLAAAGGAETLDPEAAMGQSN
jgi:ABC-type sugar transport system ATPase subunit